MWDYTVS